MRLWEICRIMDWVGGGRENHVSIIFYIFTVKGRHGIFGASKTLGIVKMRKRQRYLYDTKHIIGKIGVTFLKN